jgi:hypothetical protein
MARTKSGRESGEKGVRYPNGPHPGGRAARERTSVGGEDGSSRAKQATNAGVAPLTCYTRNAQILATLGRRSPLFWLQDETPAEKGVA